LPGRSPAAEAFRQRVLHYRVNLRGTAVAEENETIACPIGDARIRSIIADGAYAEQGEVITVFDDHELKRKVRDNRNIERVKDAETAEHRASVDNLAADLQDALNAAIDKRAVLALRRKDYLALPDTNAVRIAAGRLKIAEIGAEAATDDLSEARDRMDRGLLSAVEYGNCRRHARRQEALLAHARKNLAYARLPVSRLALRRLDLEIENADLEIARLRTDAGLRTTISECEHKGVLAWKHEIAKQVEADARLLSEVEVKAPHAGHVIHRREFRNRFLNGGRPMWRHMNYLLIPDEDTLVFQAILDERHRPYLKPGDRADIVVTGRPDTVLPGRITHIDRLPHDMSEKEEEDTENRDETASGVMVYNIRITPDHVPEWLRIGHTARCTITGSRTIRGPSVPATYVRTRANQFFVSIDGAYRPVSGQMVQGFFVADDESLDGTAVAMHGTSAHVAEADIDGRGPFDESGKLAPVDQAKVMVGHIVPRWQKVSWMAEEGSNVKKDDVVARLADDESRIAWEGRVVVYNGVSNSMVAAEGKLALARRTGELVAAQGSNRLEIAWIDLCVATSAVDQVAVFDAELAVDLAQLEVEELAERLVRVRNGKMTTASPLKLCKLERAHARAVLQQEEADIALRQAMSPVTDVERCEAELAFLDQQLKSRTASRKLATQVAQATIDLLEQKDTLHWKGVWMTRRRRALDKCTMYAPRDGVVQYQKIWNSYVMSKVNVGSEVGTEYVIMTVSDFSRMNLRIPVPEQHFTRVHKGMELEIDIPSMERPPFTGKVTEIEYAMKNREKKIADVGLYAGHERHGESVFFMHVEIADQGNVKLEPGTVARVTFPFET